MSFGCSEDSTTTREDDVETSNEYFFDHKSCLSRWVRVEFTVVRQKPNPFNLPLSVPFPPHFAVVFPVVTFRGPFTSLVLTRPFALTFTSVTAPPAIDCLSPLRSILSSRCGTSIGRWKKVGESSATEFSFGASTQQTSPLNGAERTRARGFGEGCGRADKRERLAS